MQACEAQPITIFRGDDTDGLGYQSIKGRIKTDLDLTGCRMVFRYLGFTQVYDPIPESKKFVVTIPAEATAKFPPGMGFASLRVYDENGKVRTFTNRIPVFVSMTAPSCVGGDFDVEFTGGMMDLEPLKIWTKDGFVDYDGYVERIIDKATADRFGLAMLKDTFESGDDADSGIAATPKSVNAAYAAILGELTDNYYNKDTVDQKIEDAKPEGYDDLKQRVSDIEDVIPEGASDENQLADKEWTDTQIDRLAAYYITSDAQGNAFQTYASLVQEGRTYYSGGVARTPTRNDYAVVLADETHDGAEWRYIYATNGGSGQWEAQYPIETNDYAGLSNKPSINNITLSGNKTSSDLGLLGNSGAQTLNGTLAIKDQTGYKNVFRGGTGGDLYIDTYSSANVLQCKVQFPTGGGDLGAIALKREVPTSASDIGALGNNGNQTLNGTLTATYFKSDPGNGPYCIFGMDGNGKAYIDIDPTGGAGAQRTLIPLGHNETLALLADMYAAVQQIAPAFSESATYAKNGLCSYEGVVYQCVVAKTQASATPPPNDIYDASTSPNGHWTAKKVSELFLPLTGGIVDGEIRADSLNVASCQINSTMGGAGLIIGKANSSDKLIFWAPEGGGMQRIATLTSIAPKYSASATYALNELCVYSNVLYRCTTAITTEEAWTAAHWTEATVEDVLAAIRSALDDKAPLASPAFTGAPTAPNMGAQSTDGQIANKKYVDDSIAGATDPVYDNAMAGVFSMDTELQSAASIQDVAIIKLSQLLGEDVSLYEPAQAAA